MTRRRHPESLPLIAPVTGFLLLFLAFPLIVDLVYSVSNVTFETLRTPEVTGLGNFADVLGDGAFWSATGFSFRFGLLTAAAETLLGLGLAIFLAPLLQKRPWLMAILMMPMMVAPAMVGLMYRLVLHEFVGPVPHYLWSWFGDSPSFLDAQSAFWTLATIETLQWTPFALVILYSAYQSIPPAVVEAARIDGAGPLRNFLHIELPLMLPSLVAVGLIRFIDGFRVFDNVYTLTGSGAGGSTTSLSIYIYLAFFREGAIGKAVAASMVLLVAAFVVLYAVNRLVMRRGAAA
ncbi:MAG: sugar ABC transporter permease [Alphaproteobacteria bacterium]